MLFDVDGTFAETEEIHRQSFNRAFQQAGLNWFWSTQLYTDLLAITGGKERIRYFIDHYTPTFVRPENLSEFIADLHANKTKIYQQELESGCVPLRPGVNRLIQEARAAGIRLGIATTTTPKNVTVLLERTLSPDSPKWFDVIAAGNVVSKKKPAPDIYLYALQHLKESPQSCLAIEDSENGLHAALHAGIKTIVAVSQYSQGQNFRKAVLTVDHLGEPDMHSTASIGTLNANSYVDLDLLRQIVEHAPHFVD